MPLKPLLRRTNLLPGESLPSFLERLTLLNFYQNSSVLRWICDNSNKKQTHLDNLFRPKSFQTFSRLSQLTMISTQELFDASDHYFAPMLTPLGREKTMIPWTNEGEKQIVGPAILQRHLHCPNAVQFCSLCLKESSYHRLAWVPAVSSACLHHKCLLSNQCSNCGSSISIRELINKFCKNCKADLREMPSTYVGGNKLGMISQQAIQSWLSLALAPQVPSYFKWPDQPPIIMYQLLDKLFLSLLSCQKDWPELPGVFISLSKEVNQTLKTHIKMSPYHAFHLYRAAFKGIAFWPYGLYLFLDNYNLRNINEASYFNDAIYFNDAYYKVAVRLGAFGAWFLKAWKHQEFEFLLRAMVRYLASRTIDIPYKISIQFRDEPWFKDAANFELIEILGLTSFEK